jgi:phospholipase C
MANTHPNRRWSAAGALLVLLAALRLTGVEATATSTPTPVSPIRHIVLIDQENHSFDNVLGRFCADVADGNIQRPGADMACDGATTATLADGQVMDLPRARDVVPYIIHNVASQQTAINGGKMNGFTEVGGCGAASPIPYACFPQYYPSQIPNIAALASTYTVSDHTFEFRSTPSWVGHMVLASANADGFIGDNPFAEGQGVITGPGWGCDSHLDAHWSAGQGEPIRSVPACVPDRWGGGPYRASPVRYVPTIFDRLDAAKKTWKIYGGLDDPTQLGSGYGWAICPTFFECLGSSQADNLVPASSIIADARAGSLPNYSIVTPTAKNSQHNSFSMAVGDNWIGSVIDAIQHGPEWSSTAIFITWDDCGCFYDHVAPPRPSWGIRVPMLIVSPYARAGFTDTHEASFVSVLAFVEHTFGLLPLNSADASAYDYALSFDLSQEPLGPIKTTRTQVPPAELRRIERHLVTLDPT